MLNFRREPRYPFMKEIWNLPGSPVTLDQPPVAVNKHGIPSILEVLGLDLHPGLVPDTLRMTFDLFTVQTGVTLKEKIQEIVIQKQINVNNVFALRIHNSFTVVFC